MARMLALELYSSFLSPSPSPRPWCELTSFSIAGEIGKAKISGSCSQCAPGLGSLLFASMWSRSGAIQDTTPRASRILSSFHSEDTYTSPFNSTTHSNMTLSEATPNTVVSITSPSRPTNGPADPTASSHARRTARGNGRPSFKDAARWLFRPQQGLDAPSRWRFSPGQRDRW